MFTNNVYWSNIKTNYYLSDLLQVLLIMIVDCNLIYLFFKFQKEKSIYDLRV